MIKVETITIYQRKNDFISWEIVSPEYHPGSCECGRTNTEVTWDESIFCGYCGTEVSMEILPRRYYLGYLPLALHKCNVIMYADDTSISYASKNIEC